MGTTVIGGKEAALKFRALEGKVQTVVITGVLDAAADVVKETAQAGAPELTGAGKEEIQVFGKGPKNRDVGVGRDAFYMRFAEFGTPARTQKSTGRYTGAMPATPFLRPALEDPQVQSAAQDEFMTRMRALGAF